MITNAHFMRLIETMTSRLFVFLCAALLLLFWVAHRPCFAVDDLSPEKFLQEYREAVKRSKASNSVIQIEGSLSVRRINKQKENKIEAHISYALSNERERIIRGVKEEGGEKEFGRMVDVLGCERNFTLARSSPKETYRILELIPDSKARRSQLETIVLGHSVDSLYSLAGIPIFTMIYSKDFNFTRIEKVHKEGKVQIRVEFEQNLTNPDALGKRRGWVIFEPNNNYVICEYEFNEIFNKSPEYTVVFSGKNFYTSEGVGVPLPEDVTSTVTTFQSGKEVTRDEYHFQAERLSTEPIPDLEFTLAAYGLGDVEQPPNAPTNTLPYWAFGFAAVALGISVVLKRMARQA